VSIPSRYLHRRFERGMRAADERLGAAKGIKAALAYVFPDHWSFMLGEIALYAFIVLVGTGIFLTLYYTPGDTQVVYHGPYSLLQGEQMSEAYRSVLHISFSVPAGLLFRQVHHWAADVFVASIVLHLMRIFFTGAYRKPRDFNYYIGLLMLMLAILEGFAGYSLVDDLLSGMGLAIAYAVAMSIPFIGAQFAYLAWDGPFPGSSSFLPRLEIVHVLLIPASGHDHAPAPLAVPRPGPARAECRGDADVARICLALDRLAVRGGGCPVPRRRPDPDQPNLAMGALPPLSVGERRSARLVHRLADRCTEADAQSRAGHRQPHDHPQPVLGRSVLPACGLRGDVRLARDRTPLHR
jgi:hypothetical protein